MKNIKNILILSFTALAPVLGVCADDQLTETASQHFNPAMIISWFLIGLIVLFTLVIYVMGKVLVSSTKERLKKNLNSGMKFIILPMIAVPGFANAASGIGFNTSWNFWYLLISILVVQLLIILAFALMIKNNLSEQKSC
jgi:uncharacterized membrane protein (DUF106 family)